MGLFPMAEPDLYLSQLGEKWLIRSWSDRGETWLMDQDLEDCREWAGMAIATFGDYPEGVIKSALDVELVFIPSRVYRTLPDGSFRREWAGPTLDNHKTWLETYDERLIRDG